MAQKHSTADVKKMVSKIVDATKCSPADAEATLCEQNYDPDRAAEVIMEGAGESWEQNKSRKVKKQETAEKEDRRSGPPPQHKGRVASTAKFRDGAAAQGARVGRTGPANAPPQPAPQTRTNGPGGYRPDARRDNDQGQRGGGGNVRTGNNQSRTSGGRTYERNREEARNGDSELKGIDAATGKIGIHEPEDDNNAWKSGPLTFESSSHAASTSASPAVHSQQHQAPAVHTQQQPQMPAVPQQQPQQQMPTPVLQQPSGKPTFAQIAKKGTQPPAPVAAVVHSGSGATSSTIVPSAQRAPQPQPQMQPPVPSTIGNGGTDKVPDVIASQSYASTVGKDSAQSAPTSFGPAAANKLSVNLAATENLKSAIGLVGTPSAQGSSVNPSMVANADSGSLASISTNYAGVNSSAAHEPTASKEQEGVEFLDGEPSGAVGYQFGYSSANDAPPINPQGAGQAELYMQTTTQQEQEQQGAEADGASLKGAAAPGPRTTSVPTATTSAMGQQVFPSMMMPQQFAPQPLVNPQQSQHQSWAAISPNMNMGTYQASDLVGSMGMQGSQKVGPPPGFTDVASNAATFQALFQNLPGGYPSQMPYYAQFMPGGASQQQMMGYRSGMPSAPSQQQQMPQSQQSLSQTPMHLLSQQQQPWASTNLAEQMNTPVSGAMVTQSMKQPSYAAGVEGVNAQSYMPQPAPFPQFAQQFPYGFGATGNQLSGYGAQQMSPYQSYGMGFPAQQQIPQSQQLKYGSLGGSINGGGGGMGNASGGLQQQQAGQMQHQTSAQMFGGQGSGTYGSGGQLMGGSKQTKGSNQWGNTGAYQ